MCVAAVIFKPVPLQDLECMENDNPHGAGIAWEANGTIRFLKGLTAKEIHQMQEDEVITYPYLMHYRWATHGARINELTHPFPLGPRALFGELSGEADAVLIHNGTWNRYTQEALRHVSAGNYEIPDELIDVASDTAVAAWLALYDQSILDDVPWATAVAEIKPGTDGQPTMEITTRGTWSDHEGNWYSNLNWLTSYWTYYTPPTTGKGYDSELTNWDRYINRVHRGEVEPFSLRNKEDEHLKWDDYVDKYGAPEPKSESAQTTVESGSSSGASSATRVTDWESYLEARYGKEGAKTIQSCFGDSGNRDCKFGNECGEDCLEDLISGSGAEASGQEVEVDIDPDLVSEDFETVNEALRRKMAHLW